MVHHPPEQRRCRVTPGDDLKNRSGQPLILFHAGQSATVSCERRAANPEPAPAERRAVARATSGERQTSDRDNGVDIHQCTGEALWSARFHVPSRETNAREQACIGLYGRPGHAVAVRRSCGGCAVPGRRTAGRLRYRTATPCPQHMPRPSGWVETSDNPAS